MTTCLPGHLNPRVRSDDSILCWLSFTATSGRPTRKKRIPRDTLTSIVTVTASMPVTALANVLTNIIIYYLHDSRNTVSNITNLNLINKSRSKAEIPTEASGEKDKSLKVLGLKKLKIKYSGALLNLKIRITGIVLPHLKYSSVAI